MSMTLTLLPITTETTSPDSELSLVEKWQRFVEKKKKAKKTPNVWVPRVYFCLMAATLLYNSLEYFIPYSFGDLTPWGMYYMKVLVCFICINCVANFLCLIFYDTSLQKTKDRAGLPGHLWEKPPDRFIPYLYAQPENSRMHGNGKRPNSSMEIKDGLPWGYCSVCEMDIPPRAFHCKICKKCILKRDHHCYLTGVCVGHYNQRYFVMLSLYTMVSCGWGFCLTYSYVTAHFWGSVEYLDFFPPYSLYKLATGDWEPHQFVMIHHLWILCLFAFAGAAYFFAQILLVVLNRTLFELAYDCPYRSTTTVFRNFRSVFGDFWALNIIFPAQILFRQSDDGRFWEGLKRKPQHVL